jgi:hypothetical protein
MLKMKSRDARGPQPPGAFQKCQGMRRMMNVLDVSERYENQWVVLDRGQNVLDFGTDLEQLWAKHHKTEAKVTFYFASAFQPQKGGEDHGQ